MRRRQNLIWLQPPAELATFDAREWAEPGDHGAWGPAYGRWTDARHAWVRKHGTETGLGRWLDVMRAERRAREAHQGDPA
jgi:hypothetical protein